MIDENFICEVCKKEVKSLGYTARDHCPYCLSSKHVDINPGDRKCTC
ncbi:MAG: RNHCP domain-containing protein, partial [Bacilli bacterium]|nr:RNHCP domain-containing protein [Bacilli bacterium]